MAAAVYQSGQAGLSSARMVAAVKAALAWPLGKLLLRGLRILNARWTSHGGRVRRKKDLITPFTSSDSAPRMADSRMASLALSFDRRPRAAPTRCQISEKSPTSEAP